MLSKTKKAGSFEMLSIIKPAKNDYEKAYSHLEELKNNRATIEEKGRFYTARYEEYKMENYPHNEATKQALIDTCVAYSGSAYENFYNWRCIHLRGQLAFIGVYRAQVYTCLPEMRLDDFVEFVCDRVPELDIVIKAFRHSGNHSLQNWYNFTSKVVIGLHSDKFTKEEIKIMKDADFSLVWVSE